MRAYSYTAFLLACCISVISSCNSKNYNKPLNSIVDNEKKSFVPENDDDIVKVASSFYKWYLNYEKNKDTSIFLNISRGSNDRCTLKNLDNYLNSLKSIGTLSDNFIGKEHQRLLECKKYLEQLKWDSTKTYYEYTDGTLCEDSFKFWLLNTQESVDTFNITNVNRLESTIEVTVAFISDDHPQYFESDEILIKKDNKWMIDAITPRRKY